MIKNIIVFKNSVVCYVLEYILMTLYFRFNLEFYMVYNKNAIFIARLIARGF